MLALGVFGFVVCVSGAFCVEEVVVVVTVVSEATMSGDSLRTGFYPLERSQDVFSWDPL